MSHIEEALAAHWGDRCLVFVEGCPVCDAWAELDAMRVQLAELVKTNANLAAEVEWLRVAVDRKP